MRLISFVPEGIRKPFRHANYRYFVSGQLVAVLGVWMQMIAASWLVYRMTGSSLMLGVVNFAAMMPSFILAPFGGIIADKFNKKHILYATQLTSFVVSCVLGILIITGLVEIWHIVLAAVLSGSVMSVDAPTRNAFIVDMVGKDDLQNAIAINSSVFNMGRLVGPAIGGFLIPFMGEGWLYILNGIAYLCVCSSLYKISFPQKVVEKSTSTVSALSGLGDGFKFAFTKKGVFYALILLGLGAIFLSPQSVLLPMIVVNIFQGDSALLGLLTTASGVGALIAALMLASRTKKEGLLLWLSFGLAFSAIGMTAFGLSTNLTFSILMLICIGFGSIMHMAATNTLLQLMTPDKYRGRVMSLYSMMMMGMGTFGSLAAGTAGEFFGPQNTLLFCGIGLICITVFGLPLLWKHARGKF